MHNYFNNGLGWKMSINVVNLSKFYRKGLGAKRIQAIDCLSFDVAAGEVFGLLGPNGAGKSTAIKTLLNFVFPDAGTIEILGLDPSDSGLRKRIGYLPENPCYYKNLTAMELLSFGAEVSGVGRRNTDGRIKEILEKVKLVDAAKRQLKTYSKGMVQRFGLALALIHDPQLVILDEPMSGLDPIGRKLVGDLILEMKAQGKTVLISSHILNDAERFCDRVGIVVGGRLRRLEKIPQLLNEYTDLETAFLATVRAAEGDC
jgi:ABC-2 type transport system ATP-binding protein